MRHRANKTLGQNFLKSRRALGQIVRAAEIIPGETVLEIGPGKGVLTRVLIEAGARVVAVEKDEMLVTLLQETFAAEIADGKLKLVSGDILEIKNIEELVDGAGNSRDARSTDRATSYKLVANIPYYITGQIIRTFLSEHVQPSRMVLLLQKEVVDRIIARDGKESLLSLAVKAYGVPKKVGIVKREDFSPAPNVDSAIILIGDISKKFFAADATQNATDLENKFFDILHAGFSHKRKRVLRNLEGATPQATKENLEQFFATEKIDPNTRAEDLSLTTWGVLTRAL